MQEDPNQQQAADPLSIELRNLKRQKSKQRRFCTYFKQLDLYGKQITLTFKGDDLYKTRIGATVSFILLSLLISYALYKGMILLNKENSDIRRQTYFMNINHDSEVKVLDGYDFAFKVNDLVGNDVYDETYFKLTITQTSRKWVTTDDGTSRYNTKVGSINLPYTKCGFDRLNYEDSESIEYIGINNYYCVSDKNYSVYGAYYSDYFRYVSMKLQKCYNTTTSKNCKSTEEIDAYIVSKQPQLSFVFVNNYFDSNSFDTPVKSYLDDTFYWSLLTTNTKKANIYFKKNRLQLSDTYLSGIFPSEDQFFFQVENFREVLEPMSSEQELAVVYFRFDHQYDNYERSIYGVSDFLGEVGGFQSSIIFLGSFLVGIFTQRLFYANVIKKIYQQDIDEKTLEKERQSKINPIETFAERFTKAIRNKFDTSNIHDPKERVKAFSSFISQKNTISEQISQHLHNIITMRKRFNYTTKDVIQYLCLCLCMRKKKTFKDRQELRNHFFYKKGQDKVIGELDCVSMIRSLRYLKLMTLILLSQKQKLLLKFQKKNVLDSDNTTSSDSEHDEIDPMKFIYHKNFRIRNLFKDKLMQVLSTFAGKELTDIDKKLLTGLNQKRIFDEDKNKDKILGGLKRYLIQKVREEEERQNKEKALQKLSDYRDKLLGIKSKSEVIKKKGRRADKRQSISIRHHHKAQKQKQKQFKEPREPEQRDDLEAGMNDSSFGKYEKVYQLNQTPDKYGNFYGDISSDRRLLEGGSTKIMIESSQQPRFKDKKQKTIKKSSIFSTDFAFGIPDSAHAEKWKKAVHKEPKEIIGYNKEFGGYNGEENESESIESFRVDKMKAENVKHNHQGGMKAQKLKIENLLKDIDMSIDEKPKSSKKNNK